MRNGLSSALDESRGSGHGMVGRFAPESAHLTTGGPFGCAKPPWKRGASVAEQTPGGVGFRARPGVGELAVLSIRIVHARL
jgi:hypothetical protein